MIFSSAMIALLVLSSTLMVIPSASAQNEGENQHDQQDAEKVIEITSITFSDDFPDEDEEITITAIISNNNKDNEFANGTVSFFYYNEPEFDEVEPNPKNSFLIGIITDLSVGPGENISVNLIWVAVKYEHLIWAKVNGTMESIAIEGNMETKAITVIANPIGDVASLVFALLFVMAVIVGIVLVPSIYDRLRGAATNK